MWPAGKSVTLASPTRTLWPYAAAWMEAPAPMRSRSTPSPRAAARYHRETPTVAGYGVQGATKR
ncbi:MAG: hypothetical protein IT208_14895 [Chthonomonadales bacterium]|nr:hypothetical protein [Chthonomonadales bacterium]